MQNAKTLKDAIFNFLQQKLSRTLQETKGLYIHTQLYIYSYIHTCVSASEEGIDLKLLRQFPSRIKYLLREY